MDICIWLLTCIRVCQGVVKICQLPDTMTYEHQWPVLKVPQRCTVSRIVHHYEHNIFAVAATVFEPADEEKIAEFELKCGMRCVGVAVCFS